MPCKPTDTHPPSNPFFQVHAPNTWPALKSLRTINHGRPLAHHERVPFFRIRIERVEPKTNGKQTARLVFDHVLLLHSGFTCLQRKSIITPLEKHHPILNINIQNILFFITWIFFIVNDCIVLAKHVGSVTSHQWISFICQCRQSVKSLTLKIIVLSIGRSNSESRRAISNFVPFRE